MPPAKAYPFCSDRCKVVDLGKWLDGSYAVPVVDDDETAPRLDEEGKIVH